MIHNGEELLYPGRICAYEADKILKNSDYVTPQLDNGSLFCRLHELLIEDVDRVVSVSSYTKFQ